MKTEIISTKYQSAIPHGVDVIQRNGLVAFPTDTVYGLATSAFNTASIERLFIIKGRNQSKAIALLLSNMDQLEQVATEISNKAKDLANNFWPGPLTLVLSRHPSLPDNLSNRPTIGIRIPNHPVALALINETGPLAVTSANLSGQKSPSTANEVYEQLNQKIHLIIDGGTTSGGVPSTVVDCITNDIKLLREGPIPFVKIQSAIT